MAGSARSQVQSETQSGHDPLDYWLAQERSQGLEEKHLEVPQADEPRLQGGWWLLPVMVMAVPAWTTILWMAFGQ